MLHIKTANNLQEAVSMLPSNLAQMTHILGRFESQLTKSLIVQLLNFFAHPKSTRPLLNRKSDDASRVPISTRRQKLKAHIYRAEPNGFHENLKAKLACSTNSPFLARSGRLWGYHTGRPNSKEMG